MKNSPSPAIEVSSLDPRDILAAELDSQIQSFTARNRSLAAQRKQLDLETQANDDAIAAAQSAIALLDEARSRARALVFDGE